MDPDKNQSTEEASTPSSLKEKKSKGYASKRPFWQWVLLYIVIAIVVYGLIYIIFIHKGGGGSSSGSSGY